MSGEGSSSSREATISVLRDTGSKVILTIKVPGLKRRRSLLKSLLNLFRKPSDPFRLSSNAQFVEYKLTDTGLVCSVDVYDDQRAMKARSEVKQNYFCRIEQFPSRINPDSAEFQLMQGASGDCYFLLTCIKVDNYGTSWKDFQASNGTLDATKI
ncbi:LIN-33 protein [Aphelenchoides avenae]|nr:LIN-33 protein [Aphelenchus avenae]